MLVFDIETYQDTDDALYTAYKSGSLIDKRLKDVELVEKDRQRKIREKFGLHPLTGKVLITGFLCDKKLTTKPSELEIDGIPLFIQHYGLDGEDERTTLARTLELMEAATDNGEKLVTYNGKAFDMPYIFRRALINGVAKPNHLSYQNLVDRYKNANHADLFTILNPAYGEYNSLPEWSYRVKDSDSLSRDGSMVAEWFEAHQFDSIKQHLNEDLIRTYLLYKKVESWLI